MKKVKILSLLIAVGLLTGCSMWEESGGAITFNGKLTASSDGFVMDGEIINSGQVTPPPEFPNLTVYLFAANGTLIEANNLGTMQSEVSVTITSNKIPKYVIIYSDKFQRYDDIDIGYYEYVPEDNIYAEHVVGSKDEFPVQLTEARANTVAITQAGPVGPRQ